MPLLIHPWLIRLSGSLLRSPKPFIILPIVVVFLVAYNAVYDVARAVGPGNLSSAHSQKYTPPEVPDLSWLHVTRLLFSADNVLHPAALNGLCEIETQLKPLGAILLPFPVCLGVSGVISSVDPAVSVAPLLAIIHDMSPEVTGVFLDKVHMVNHVTTAASTIYWYVFHNCSAEVVYNLSLVVPNISVAQAYVNKLDFVAHYNLVSGRSIRFKIAKTAVLLQALGAAYFILHVYFSISNLHVIRSNAGLMFGWLTSVVLSALASWCLLSWYRGLVLWAAVLPPVLRILFIPHICVLMALSSRNLFRTVNDLAGDDLLADSSELHKRLIMYYLGINCSTHNQQGVYELNRRLRQLLRLDRFAARVWPIPNTLVILLINIVGLHLVTTVVAGLVYFLVPSLVFRYYFLCMAQTLVAQTLALFIDHFLQLTYLVSIIVIDLNRVTLLDIFDKGHGPEPNETNPIAAYFLRGKKGSLRHRIGTFFVTDGPLSLRQFWTILVPLLVLVPSTLSYFMLQDVKADGSFAVIAHPVACIRETDHIFYMELAAITVFVLAGTELVFLFTYSKRQRKQPDFTGALILPSTDLTVQELARRDSEKHFEEILLTGHHSADVIRLELNPKCSFLVLVDLDHKVLVWSPLSKVDFDRPKNIATVFGDSDTADQLLLPEFWPVNRILISPNGNYIVLISYKHCRIKCFSRLKGRHIWEVSLTLELSSSSKKMALATSFFRQKTVAGFLARKLLKEKRPESRRNSALTVTGNFPLQSQDDSQAEIENQQFVMVLETGEMITVSCENTNIKAYNILKQFYESLHELSKLRIVSARLLSTARVNDRIVCNLSNDELVVGIAVNNLWRFQKLDVDLSFTSPLAASYAPPLMSRTGSTNFLKNDFTSGVMQRQDYPHSSDASSAVFPESKYSVINKSTIVPIDFVGMVIRVKDLQAQLIDIQSGTIVKVFHIGHFKPNSFRVAHSEPTHCKFCGCASFESFSLIYEDFYDKIVIVHTYVVENKKSRSNICLRVERDPREIRCLGFDSVIEKQNWYEGVEKWELTDMNILIGIKKAEEPVELIQVNSEPHTIRHRRSKSTKNTSNNEYKLNSIWQAFVVTVHNGKLLEYSIPNADNVNFACTRPTAIHKYGFKSVAIAFGRDIRILFLGADKLIENDLYFSGAVSTSNPMAKPSDGVTNSNELLFINKRRRMVDRKKSQETETGV